MNAIMEERNTATPEEAMMDCLLERIVELEEEKAALLKDNDEIRRQLASMRCR